MFDLKPYFDAAQAANDEVQRVMDDMNAAFSDGTDEGKSKALEMRPALDAAKKKAEDANALYISMRNAAGVSENGAARVFIPVTDKHASSTGDPAREMSRQDFLALDAAARMDYIRQGGTVVDEVNHA